MISVAKKKPMNESAGVSHLKSIREAQEMTQTELAQELGISEQMIRNYEKRPPKSVFIAVRIAEALDCDIKEIFVS